LIPSLEWHQGQGMRDDLKSSFDLIHETSTVFLLW
jgi:hypothetical protein